jgi:hypothetical protein
MNEKVLKTYTLTELKKFVSNTNIKNYSKLKKNELINLMLKKEHKDKFLHIKEKPKKKEEKKEEKKEIKPKKQEPKKQEPKKQEPKKQEPKKQEPKKQEPKKLLLDKLKITDDNDTIGINYYDKEVFIMATIDKENGNFFLDTFISYSKKKGLGRFLLCELIRYLLKNKIGGVNKKSKFRLRAAKLNDFGYKNKFSQKKLNQYYESIGFTKEKGSLNYFSTNIKEFLDKCDEFKFLD